MMRFLSVGRSSSNCFQDVKPCGLMQSDLMSRGNQSKGSGNCVQGSPWPRPYRWGPGRQIFSRQCAITYINYINPLTYLLTFLLTPFSKFGSKDHGGSTVTYRAVYGDTNYTVTLPRISFPSAPITAKSSSHPHSITAGTGLVSIYV